jgi:hypothetical protein
MTLPHVASPPLAPLSIPQRNFLALHARYFVERYRWHFSECALRAHAGTKSATIWCDELDDLVGRGLMQMGGPGRADVALTALGREVVRERA